MPRWLEVVLTLILFTIGMTVLSWVVHATVPGFHAWLIERLGQAGFWTALVVLGIVLSAYGWHGHRRATKASGR